MADFEKIQNTKVVDNLKENIFCSKHFFRKRTACELYQKDKESEYILGLFWGGSGVF